MVVTVETKLWPIVVLAVVFEAETLRDCDLFWLFAYFVLRFFFFIFRGDRSDFKSTVVRDVKAPVSAPLFAMIFVV